MSDIKIKEIYPSFSNILIVDAFNRLWIMGSNADRKCGYGKKNLYFPTLTHLILDEGEQISHFYCESSVAFIYTSNKKLYISNFTASKKQTDEQVVEYDSDSEDQDANTEEDIRETFLIMLTQNYTRINQNDTIVPDDEPRRNDPTHMYIFGLNSSETTCLNNNQYFLSLDKPKIKTGEGFSLLASDVDKIMVSSDTVLFLWNNKICLFDKTLKIKDAVANKKCSLSMVLNKQYDHYFYELTFPFDFEKLVFNERFVYGYANGYHHVLFVGNTNYVSNVIWIYFKAPFAVESSHIYINAHNSAVYVKKNNSVYAYDHKTHTLSSLLENKHKIFMLNENDGTGVLVCTLDNNWLCCVLHGKYSKICAYNQLLHDFVDIDIFFRNELIIINNSSEARRYCVYDKSVYFNICGLEYYKLLSSGVVYYDNGMLYYFSPNELSENKYNTIEIDKIYIENVPFYLYKFIGVPEDIQDVVFTNGMILIRTSDKYYYHYINDDDATNNFTVSDFTEIVIKNDNKNIVQKHFVIRDRKKFESSVEISVHTDSDKLEKFVNIMEFFRPDVDFTISYIDKSKQISYGDGPKREFMECAIQSFADKYLHIHGTHSTFNLETIETVSKNGLICIGSMLHAVICHSSNNLPFKLPVMLLVAIKKRIIYKEELEFFVKIIAPELYDAVVSYRNDPEKFAAAETDFATYDDMLINLCGIPFEEDELDKLQKICKYIAKGFTKYAEIKNLESMNYPTLEYYISGDYVVDRKILIANLSMDDEYRGVIVDIIQSLSEENLSILLKNWTGTSVVKKKYKYKIAIKKKAGNEPDIFFMTCYMAIEISKPMMTNPELRPLLIDLLTTPIDTMVDN